MVGEKRFWCCTIYFFTANGEVKGVQKSYGPMTFLKVHDVGHMVSMDQPKAALEMLQRWTQGKLL
ncbi:hypothetical protein FXO38_25710 [Capsicum annuum]|uniref:Uncharacterized protein n=1 Tax=Capsicum annuum TaxID=4072 RepID=A0A2G2ZN98_CAPAN|nr:hypothetical protein FXO38_25710 [Capsicum annuum]KAF3640339.1 hypothetical protein FXO37_23543 [Capsicum annuum]PHT83421.1 hypothetical protein T459_11864 [Capsicum annuum]